MKEIKFSKTTGNFKYDVTANVSDAVLDRLIEEGMVRCIQGAPLGGWEKSIAYPGKDAKRPVGFTRTDIPFNEENAAKLAQVLKGLEVSIGENEKGEDLMEDLGITDVVVTEYAGPEKAEPKYKAEKDLLNTYLFEADGKTERMLKSGGPRTAASFAESRGIAAPTEPWAEDTAFLQAVKVWQKAQAAEQD